METQTVAVKLHGQVLQPLIGLRTPATDAYEGGGVRGRDREVGLPGVRLRARVRHVGGHETIVGKKNAFASAEVRVRDGDSINYVATRHDGTSTLITFNNVGTATQMTNLASSTSRTMKETRLAPLCGRSTWARFPCGVPGLREALVGAVGVIRGRSPVSGRKSSPSFHIENARCKQRGFLPTQRRKQCGFLLV